MTNIGDKTFSGTSKVFDGTLSNTIKQLAQAQTRMVMQGEADLTDNSGGTAGSSPYTITDASVTAVVATYTGASAAPKTEVDLAFGDVRDAIATLIEKLEAAHTGVVAIGPFVDSTAGTAGAGTIAAIDVSYIAVNGAGAVDFTTFNTIADAYDDSVSQLTHHVNRLLTANGGTLVTNSVATPLASFSKTFAALSIATDTAVDGTAAASVENSVAQDFFTELADNIAKLAAAINSITADVTTFPVSGVVAVD